MNAHHPTPLTRRPVALSLTALYLLLATLELTNLGLDLLAPEKLGLVFNDMSQRLLHWDFTIDPATIAFEAFTKDGRTYTYFGIYPALLRIPLVLLGGVNTHVARISCLAATTLAVYAYLRTYQAAFTGPTPPARPLIATVLLSAVATGPQIYLLASASIYHEVIFWAAAFGALFNLVVMRRFCQGEPLTRPDLYKLATLAGLCILCRSSLGFGLYLALLLLLLQAFLTSLAAMRRNPRLRASLATAIAHQVGAGLLSLAFLAVVAIVNLQRWNDPLAIGPLQYYGQIAHDPALLAIYLRDGVFAWARVAMSAAYYTAGIKLEDHWPALFEHYYHSIEGPRVIVPITAPLTVALALAGLFALLRRPRQRLAIAALATGHALAVVAMLGFLAICLRYTFDAWGLLTLLAALALNANKARLHSTRLLNGAAILLLVLGMAGSQLTLLRYKIVYSGTDPETRYTISRIIHPLLCPKRPLNAAIKLTDFNPLYTTKCPPLW